MTFTEFSKTIKPTELKPYIQRLKEKDKKAVSSCVNEEQKDILQAIKESEYDLKKPLTAFKKSSIYLNKNEFRHIKLTPQ